MGSNDDLGYTHSYSQGTAYEGIAGMPIGLEVGWMRAAVWRSCATGIHVLYGGT